MKDLKLDLEFWYLFDLISDVDQFLTYIGRRNYFLDEETQQTYFIKKDAWQNVEKLILRDFNISQEISRPFILEIFNQLHNGRYDALDISTKIEKAKDQQFFLIAKALKDIESSNVEAFSFKLVLHKEDRSKETIDITVPEISLSLLEYLRSLPKERKYDPKRGQPEKKHLKAFIRSGIRKCFAFLKTHATEKHTETDKLYFAGMVLSLTNRVFITPDFYIEKEGFDPQEGINEYKKYIADKLKYYK